MISAVLQPVRLLALRLMLAQSPQTVARGMTIVDITASEDSALLLKRIADALHVFAALDARRWRRATQDLSRIVLTHARAAAKYVPSASACFVDVAYTRCQTPEVIASAIVHEATHARLWKAGIRYESWRRARIERRCIREELAFLACTRDTQGLIEVLQARLRRGAD